MTVLPDDRSKLIRETRSCDTASPHPFAGVEGSVIYNVGIEHSSNTVEHAILDYVS